MFRRSSILVALVSVTLASIGSDAHACGGRGRYSFGNSYRPSVRYARPVVRTVVQPTMTVRPTVVQKVVVAPQPAEPQLPTVPAGSTLTLPANFLGSQPGSVFMVFGNIKLPVEVRRWEPTGVTITLPPMAIKTAVEIRVDVVLPDGKLGMTRQLRVTKPASVVVHPTAPTSSLPTQNAIQQTFRQAHFLPTGRCLTADRSTATRSTASWHADHTPLGATSTTRPATSRFSHHSS